jgi:hypothetical protein
MPTFTFFHEFRNVVATTVDLDAHTFKVALATAAPDAAANTVLADITQTAGAGYVSGGYELTGVTWLETGAGTGVWRFSAAELTIQAVGGPIDGFQYLVLYDDTVAGKPLVGYLDNGSVIALTDGSAMQVAPGGSGIFELS